MGFRYWATRSLMFVLAAMVALFASRYFFLPRTETAGEEFGRHLSTHGMFLYAHVGGGAVALLAGALQWLLTSTTRRSRWHWLIGRTYVAAILVGGVAGLVIATRAFGGMTARAGFSLLAVSWLTSTAVAFIRARARDWNAHRQWMIRSFALTFAAVTLRLWLPLLSVMGVPFEVAYPPVAWLCWVPNLVVAEWLIARDERRSVPRSARVPVRRRSKGRLKPARM